MTSPTRASTRASAARGHERGCPARLRTARRLRRAGAACRRRTAHNPDRPACRAASGSTIPSGQMQEMSMFLTPAARRSAIVLRLNPIARAWTRHRPPTGHSARSRQRDELTPWPPRLRPPVRQRPGASSVPSTCRAVTTISGGALRRPAPRPDPSPGRPRC